MEDVRRVTTVRLEQMFHVHALLAHTLRLWAQAPLLRVSTAPEAGTVVALDYLTQPDLVLVGTIAQVAKPLQPQPSSFALLAPIALTGPRPQSPVALAHTLRFQAPHHVLHAPRATIVWIQARRCLARQATIALRVRSL